MIDQRLFLFCKANIASYLFTESLLLKEVVLLLLFEKMYSIMIVLVNSLLGATHEAETFKNLCTALF